MLNPHRDRVNYVDALRPPVGYRLAEAVCTTYSLDLEMLIAATIQFGYDYELSDEDRDNPVVLLSALRRAKDFLVIFCDAGQLKVPCDLTNQFYSLLDEMIVPVKTGSGKYPPSFHPKTWILRYQDKSSGKSLWRFVVMSRNLAKDNSWDLSVSLDGEEGGGNVGASEPLRDFLAFLHRQIPGTPGDLASRKEIVKRLLDQVGNVTFAPGKPFVDFEIIPLGLKKNKTTYGFHQIEFPDWFHECVVVSPFADSEFLKDFNDPNRGLTGCRRVLITRRLSICGIDREKLSNFETYVFRDVTDEQGRASDLHAKLYLLRRDSKTTLFVGSMNATKRGRGKNVEMMLRLTTAKDNLDAGKFLEELCGGEPDGPKSPLERVLPDEVGNGPDTDEQKDEREAENLIARICRLKMSATYCHRVEDASWSVVLEVKGDIPNCEVLVSLFGFPGNKVRFSSRQEFTGISPSRASCFFIIEVKRGRVALQRLLRVPTEGLPKEREVSILNGIVKADRQKLQDFFVMVLSPNPTLALIELTRAGAGDRHHDTLAKGYPACLYEEMLRASVDDGERIREVGYVLDRLDVKDEWTDACRKLFRTFAAALNIEVEK